MATSLGSFTEPSSQPDYPYLVIRYSKQTLRNYPIWFIKKEDKEFLSPDSKNLVIGIDKSGFEEDGAGVDVSRELIVNSARIHLQEQRFPLCVVFGEGDCVYLEHDGSIHESETMPAPAPEYES